MEKITAKQCRGMNLWAKVSLIVLCTLLFSMFMVGGILKPTQSQAAITTVSGNAWSEIYTSTTAFPGTVGYTVNAGSGTSRMLVVAVSSSVDTAGAKTCTATYGNQNMTMATSDGGTTQAHTFIFYLNEAGLDAAQNTNLVFTFSGTPTASVQHVYATVYDGVDQGVNPLTSVSSNLGTTSVALTTGLAIANGDQAVEVVNMNRTGATTYRTLTTPATGWTNVISSANATDNTVYNSSDLLTSTTPSSADTAAHAISSTAASIYAMSAISIKQLSFPYTTAGTATAVNGGLTSINVNAPYSDDNNADNTLLVEYKLSSDSTWTIWTGSALPHADTPYFVSITGLTTGLSYDVRVTYQDPDTVVGTATQTVTGITTAAVPIQRTYFMTRDTTTDLVADGTCNITGLTPYTSTVPGKTTTSAAEFGTASRYYPTTTGGSSIVVLNVYSQEYSTNAVDISNISASIAFRGNATSDTIKLDLYDYDPNGAPGNGTLVASSAAKAVTQGTTLAQYTWTPANFTLNGSGRVAQNHRLQFRLTQYSATTTSTSRLYFGIAGTTASTNFTVTETAIAGAGGTTTGTATAAVASSTSIRVTAPYSDDGNGNNTLRVEYKLAAAPDTSYVIWTGADLPHSATPYTTVINGLTRGSAYSIRVTYLDADGVSGTAVQTITPVTPDFIPYTTTYFMTRDTTTNLSADGTCNITGLTPYTASPMPAKTTTSATEFGTASRYYPTTTAGQSIEVLKVYTPVYTGNAVSISNISASIAFRGNAASDTIKLDLYDYDPAGAANNGTLVASSTAKTVNGGTTLTRYTWAPADFTINGSGLIAPNHRLQFRLTQYSATSTSTSRLYFGIAGNTASTNFTVTQTPVAGANSTTAGTATAWAAGSTRIKVSAPYADDGNSNNTLLVEYKRSADSSYTVWQNMAHSDTPYATQITGLSAGTSYDVRVTYQDADTVTGVAQQVITGVVTPAASIEVYDDWARVINDSTVRATGVPVSLSGNFTVTAPAGNSRLLVVAITQANRAANTAPGTPSSITYGGVPLRLATTNRQTSSRAHTWLYYLKDNAVMDGTSRPVVVSWATGIASTKIDVTCAVYVGVDQLPTSYTTGTQIGTASATTAMSLSVAMPVIAKARAIYLLNVANVTNATIPTYTTSSNWTTPLSSTPTTITGYVGTTYSYSIQLADRVVSDVDTSDSATTGVRNAASYFAMSAMVLPPLAVAVLDGAAVPNQNVYSGSLNKVADAFILNGASGISSIQITGNANTTSANISAVRIYQKGDANTTVYTQGVDIEVGSGNFGATEAPLNIPVNLSVSTPTNYIIVYDIASGAIASGTSKTFTAKVTATTPAASSVTDTGATLTLLATTTLGIGASEPPAVRLTAGSIATNMDAFSLQHNGTSPTDDDAINTVIVTLTPALISGGSGSTKSKIRLVEIVNQAGDVVYGSANAATTGDIWNIATTGLTATSTLSQYFIRISTANAGDWTPSAGDTSGTPTGYYIFTGKVSDYQHLRTANRQINDDDFPVAKLELDVEKPAGPATATATEGTGAGEINLVWAAASDPNSGSLDALKPYKIVRATGAFPDPGCATGTDLSTVPTVTIDYVNRSTTDNGLIDTTPTRYYYRACAKDAQGNLSDGATSYANSHVTSICNNPPEIALTGSDGTSDYQLIKSANSQPFLLNIGNKDIGTCPDVTFTVALANEVNSVDFDKLVETDPFPATVTLGTGGVGAPTGTTLKVYITGRPSAQQLEQYKFGITVSSPGNNHGDPITTAQVTGVLNDMPPIVHNSNNMVKYQYGTWGNTYTCATCHSNSTTNIKGVFSIISTPIGRRNVVFTKHSSLETDGDGVMSTDKRANKDTSNQVCSVCHHNTRQHQYSASKPFGGPANDENYVSDHHNSRDCVRCHTHNTAFRSIYGLCGDCHGFKGSGYSPIDKGTMVKTPPTNALGPGTLTNYGAHLRHNKLQMTCGVCHSITNHGLATTAWQGDNILEIGFNISKDTYPGFNPDHPMTGGTFYGTNNLNQPYTWLGATGTTIVPIADYNNSCNTYCHGTWGSVGNGNLNAGSQTSPIWVAGDPQVACGTCHYATNAVPPTSGSHVKHAKSTDGGLGRSCLSCHSTYANYTGSAHVNGKVEWNMSAYPGATYNGQVGGTTGHPAPTTDYGTYKTCDNLYCHSDVQGADGDGTGGPTRYGSPTWGGTVACGDCHGAESNKPNPISSGSHPNHENIAVSFDCHVCHYNGGDTGPHNHADGKIDFQFTGLGVNTKYKIAGVETTQVTPGTHFGTCSASNCHGRATPQWGTPPSPLALCDKCHGSATSAGGFYNTANTSATLISYSGVGVHDIHIQNPNSPRKATFARFTSYAAGYKCEQCHIVPTGPFTAGHVNTALPAEVPFSHLSTIAHRGDQHQFDTLPTYDNTTKACNNVWCHGGGMTSNRGFDHYSGLTPYTPLVPKWNEPFLTGDGSTDCSKCHATPPPAPNSSYTHFGKTLTQCKDCHQHVTNDGHGFKDKSLHVNGIIEGDCNVCHGTPPINNIPGDKNGLVTPPTNALNGGAGAHNVHLLMPAVNSNSNPCYTCHNNYTGEMPSNELEIGFGTIGGYSLTGTFTGYTSTVDGPHWKTTTAGTYLEKSSNKGVVCSNLYCHGGGGGPDNLPPIGGGSFTSPDWEGTVACGDCHGIDSDNSPTGGSHIRHAQLVSSLACKTCHGIVEENGTHVNGAVKIRLQRSDDLIGSSATYAGYSTISISGLAPRNNGTDYRNCANVYCHSDVQGATGNGTGGPVNYQSPKWGTTGLTCGSCHKDAATDATAAGSHVKHANTSSGMGVSCGYCHQDAGFGYALHTDGSIYVNFTSYIGGAYSAGTPYPPGVMKKAGSEAYGSCSATFCHGDAPSPAWGTPGPLACNACHAAKVDDVSWSGNHKLHYNYSTLPTSYSQTVTDLSTVNKYRFNCAHCHDDNVAKHSLKPASTDSAARVFFGISTATPALSSKRGNYVAGAPAGTTDNGFYFTDGSCSTSYCHSNGRGGTPLNASLTWTTAKTGGSNCEYCHAGKATATQLSGKHDKHMNSGAILGTGNGFNCVDCHAATITNINNTTIANKGKHVNAVLNYSGVKAGNNASGTCSSVYCHSNGNPNATVFVSMTGSKVWGGTGTITTCNKCHGRSNAIGYPDYANGGANTATSNLHAGHLAGLTDTTACADCHRKTASTVTVNVFRPYSTAHLSGGPDVNFNTSKIYIGTKANVVTNGMQVTCSQIVCHGQGAPVWGASTTAGQCAKCHGSRSVAYANLSAPQIAPGYGSDGTDTSMTKKLATDPRVGAHQIHLQNSAISGPVRCGECHVPVTTIRSGNHWNYSTATVTIAGSRATGFGSDPSPSTTRVAGAIKCNNLWCHTGKYDSGSAITPSWNDTSVVNESGTTVGDCVSCHAMPPTAYSGHPAQLSNSAALSTIVASCQGCHSNVSSSVSNVANAFSDRLLHVDGIIQYSVSCIGCHDYDTSGGTWGNVKGLRYGVGNEGVGAHYKHIEYLKTRYNVTLSTSDTWTTPAFQKVCGTCHSITEGTDHSMGTPTNPRSITFGYGITESRRFGVTTPFYNGLSSTSSAANPKSCSNTDCHYKTSPIWSTY